MKLKPVVASIVMLGLMAPALAKSSMASQQAVLDQNSVISPVSCKGWFNRITIGGKASIVGALGSHSPAGMFQLNNASSDLYINNANLFFNATLSSWSKATLNLAYIGAPNPFHNEVVKGSGSSASDVGVGNRDINHTIVADEAYVTIGNFKKNPFYLVFGKKYIPFGDYADPYTPYGMMSPAQMLSQVNAVSAIAGVSSDFGLYASLFGFRGESSPLGSSAMNIRNYGGKIGYYDTLSQFNIPNTHMNLAVSYIHNLWDGQVFSPNADPRHQWFETVTSGGRFKVNHPHGFNKVAVTPGESQIEPAGGISVHGDVAYRDFSMSANYTSAMTDMISDSSEFVTKGSNRSRFWGADVNFDYAFKTFARNSSLGAGAQFSGNGAWMGDNALGITDWVRIIPRWRVVGEYKVNLFKNTDLSLVATHGKSYDFISTGGRGPHDPKTGTNKTVSAGYARLNVQF